MAGSLVLLAGLIALVMALPGAERTFDIPALQTYLLAHPLSHAAQNIIFPIVLGGFGLGLGHVVMARIYLTEFKRDYAILNRIWPEVWPAGKLPARTTVGVTALAVDALVEIDLVVRRP